MSRFAAYLGPPIPLDWLVTRPARPLVQHTYRPQDSQQPHNADGFGVAWYAPAVREEPGVYHTVVPAWCDRNLGSLVQVVESPAVVAHVRGSRGASAVTEANCHPFTYGPLSFVHNGSLAHFAKLRRTLLDELSDRAFESIRGSTDSEHLFAMFLDRYHERDADEDGAVRLTETLKETLADVAILLAQHEVKAPSSLNLAVTDGNHLVAIRRSTGSLASAEPLYLHRHRALVWDEQHGCRLVDAGPGDEAVLIASEPLTADGSWERVQQDFIIQVDADRSVELIACP